MGKINMPDDIFYGKSVFEEIEKAQQIVNEYSNRWLDYYALYGYPSLSFIEKAQRVIKNFYNSTLDKIADKAIIFLDSIKLP